MSDWVKQAAQRCRLQARAGCVCGGAAPQQRLYYALESMGLVEQLHARVFAAIHVEKQNLSQAAAIADWVARQGVDRAAFAEQFDSFAVSTKAARARQLQTAYQVEGVPALGIAGRYYTDGCAGPEHGPGVAGGRLFDRPGPSHAVSPPKWAQPEARQYWLLMP